MNLQNQEIPLAGTVTHSYFEEYMGMYLVVGQSDALGP